MSDMTTTTLEDDVPDLAPVLPEEELDDLEGEDADYDVTPDADPNDTLQADPGPQRGRGRPRKKRTVADETIHKQRVSRALDIGEWIDAIEANYGSYEQPGFKLQLERTAPLYKDGVTIGGLIAQWESKKPDIRRILEDWGGGDYKLRITISRPDQWKVPRNFTKVFRLGGAEPKIKRVPAADVGTMSMNPSSAALGIGAPPPPQPQQVHPIVEKRALDLVGDVLAHERKGGGGGGTPSIEMLKQFEGTYRTTAEQISASAEMRARAREEAAQREVAAAEARANEARLQAEAARREAERVQQETAEKVARATQESQSMLGLLLPTFNENAARQVDSISQTYLQREARIETQHAKEVDALYRQHETEMRNAAAQHQAEMTRLETVYTGQLQMYAMRLQQAEGALENERRANTQLRDAIMNLRAEENTRLLKQADPVAKLQELGTLRELVGDVLPGGGGDEGGLSDDAPDWMKMLNNFGNVLGPAIGQIMEARRAAPPQGYTPQQIAMMQAQAQAQAAQGYPQQQLPPAHNPPAVAGTPQAVAATRVTFDRSELEPAVQMLSTVRNAGTPAADAASAATKHIPHNVLRELARRTPEKVVDQLEAAGIMPSDLRNDDGRAYCRDFLVALREIVK